MDYFHGIFIVIVLLVVLLGGIPVTAYFLTKQDKKHYAELAKPRTLLSSTIAALLSFFMGKYLTPAFYIFVPIFLFVMIISRQVQMYKSEVDARDSQK